MKKKPKLNRRNLLSFANRIYSDRNGEPKYMKLCAKLISKTVNGERQVCALGAMYEHFVGPLGTQIGAGDAVIKLSEIACIRKNGVSREALKADLYNDLTKANDKTLDTMARAIRVKREIIRIAETYLINDRMG